MVMFGLRFSSRKKFTLREKVRAVELTQNRYTIGQVSKIFDCTSAELAEWKHGFLKNGQKFPPDLPPEKEEPSYYRQFRAFMQRDNKDIKTFLAFYCVSFFLVNFITDGTFQF